jgi:hypothetical protein
MSSRSSCNDEMLFVSTFSGTGASQQRGAIRAGRSTSSSVQRRLISLGLISGNRKSLSASMAVSSCFTSDLSYFWN